MKVMSRAPGLAVIVLGLLAAASGASCTTFGAEPDPSDGGAEGGLVDGGIEADSGPPVVQGEVKLATVKKPWYLAKDGDVLYVTSYRDAGVWRVSAALPSSPTQILPDQAFGVTFDDAWVYACAQSANKLVRYNKGDASVDDVDTGGCLEVVWTGGTIFVSNDLGVKRVSRTLFGAPAEFADIKRAEGLATDDKRLYVTVVDSKNGATPGVFAKQVDEPSVAQKTSVATTPGRRILVDGDDVYWLEYNDPTVKRVKRTGGTPEAVAKGLAGPLEGGIAVDATYVYWVMSGRGEIVRAKKDLTGGVESIAQGRKRPVDIVVDERNVYFTEEAADAVVRIGKPPPK